MNPGLAIPLQRTITDQYPDARSLTQAMRRGDERAWALFVERVFDHASGAVRAFTGRDESFCHDAAQDAMLKAVKKPELIDTDRALLAWTATLARTAALDRIRAENRRRRREQNTEHRATAHAENYDDLFRAMEALEPHERALLLDRVARDQTLARVAQAHGLTVGAAHGRVRRTLAKLRGSLEGTQQGAQP